MKKRLLLFLILVILPIVLAAEDEIYSDTVRSGTITAEALTFDINVADTAVYIRYNNQATLIPAGECKIRDNLRFCIGTISFVSRNSTTWENVYETTLDIYLEQLLEMNKTLEKTTLLIDEQTPGKIVLRNTGSIPAKDIVLQDSYGDGFALSDVEQCDIVGDTIEWRGAMDPNARIICTFTITALKPQTYTSKTKLSYFDGILQNNVTGELKLKVQNSSLKITPKFNASDFEIGDALNITFKVENIQAEDLEVKSLVFTVPFDILEMSSSNSDVKKAGNKINWAGTLEKNNPFNITLQIRATRSGNFPVHIEQRYLEGQFIRDSSADVTIPVICHCPIIDVSDMNDGQIRISLFNPSRTQRYENLMIDSDSNIPNIVIPAINELLPRESILLVNTPLAESEVQRYINITATYESQFKQELLTSKFIKINHVKQAEETPSEEEIEESLIIIDENETTALSEILSDISIPMPRDNRTRTILIGGAIVIVVVGQLFFVIRLLRR